MLFSTSNKYFEKYFQLVATSHPPHHIGHASPHKSRPGSATNLADFIRRHTHVQGGGYPEAVGYLHFW